MNALTKRRSTWGAEGQEQEYWVSYSDLMAGLLMMFALMLFAALHHYGGMIDQAGDVLKVKSDIIVKLDSIMEAEGAGVTVDPKTGAVLFPDGVLFAEGQATLQPAGHRQLDSFASKYFAVLLGDSVIRSQLRSVVIEGHTNDNSSYEYNLRLSQQRAFSVMEYLLKSAPEHEAALQQYVTANGRSFSQPVCKADGKVHPYPCPNGGGVDKAKSRRIEILFRLKDEEALERVRELLLVR